MGKYFQFISMNKSIANWNYLFAGIEQGLIQQSASTSNQSCSHSKDRFFRKKKKKIILNKSSSLLLHFHLHLHLLHFLIMNKSSHFKKKKKKKTILSKYLKKKRRKFSKRAFGLGALGSYFLGCFQKKKSIKIFNSLKNSRFPKFFKKKKSKIFNSFEKFKFSKFKKKKKKIFIKFFYRNRKL